MAEAGQRDPVGAVAPMGLLSIAPLDPTAILKALPQNWTLPRLQDTLPFSWQGKRDYPTWGKAGPLSSTCPQVAGPHTSHHVTSLMTSWAAMVVLSKSAMAWETCRQLVLGLHAQHLNQLSSRPGLRHWG